MSKERVDISLSDCDITDNMTQTQSTKEPHCTTFFCGLSVKASACAKVSGGVDLLSADRTIRSKCTLQSVLLLSESAD